MLSNGVCVRVCNCVMCVVVGVVRFVCNGMLNIVVVYVVIVLVVCNGMVNVVVVHVVIVCLYVMVWLMSWWSMS